MPKLKLKGVRNSDLYGSNATPSILLTDAATDPEIANFLRSATSGLAAPGTYGTEAYFTPQVDNRWKDLGLSTYDPAYMISEDPTDIQENRAQSLPGILLLGNGILKMGTTGVTTFLNSTAGLLYGLGTGIGNATGLNGENEDGSEKTFILGLWDNDFNRAMSDIQDKMEEIAPNYYSQAELNSPWYTNILSANFIGDKVLKNMGFTIGALAAMYVTGGTGVAGLFGKGAQTAAKFTLGGLGNALGASRGTLAGINNFARGTGLLAHHLVLTAIGASGEASIEAINAVKEGSKDVYNNLELRRLELLSLLNPYDPNYQDDVDAINAATALYKQEIDAKFRDAGNSVYAANLGILSVSNFLLFAPIIKGGFQRSAKLSNFEKKLGDKIVDTEEWVKGILRGENASLVNTVDRGWGRTLGLAGKNALVEGSEEAEQNLASNTSLLLAKARLNKEAESTLLGPKINPDVTNELVDYTKAFSKALYDNFGSPESKGWEEFFLGALTGGMGFIGLGPRDVKNENGEQVYDPVTHKKVTSWKPKSISDLFLGGIMEARRSVNQEYDENQIIIDAVNLRLLDPEFIKRTLHAVASKKLANDMDEALLENDMFKFKNSEIGKLVEDVFFFKDKGMIDEYKDIYRNLTNIDDKTLEQLYTATADEEGNTELSQEDKEDIRKEYEGKAKSNLEKIKMIQDYYDFVDLEYRDRSPLFKEELAYQYIRLDDTRRRINELEEKKKSPNAFKAGLLALKDYITNPNDWDGTTPSRDTYVNNVENNNGLTELEQKDLERLKRQEKLYKRRIDRAKKDPSYIDLLTNAAYAKLKREYDSKDVDTLVLNIKDASSISEIDRILSGADNSVRQDVINRVYLEGDDALKEKMQSLIAAAVAYAKSKERLSKAGWNRSDAEDLTKAMLDLLFSVYTASNLELDVVKHTLLKIHDELQEDSIATIHDLMPDSDNIYEDFIGEDRQEEKDILLDVLEGTMEDVSSGILNSVLWKTQQEVKARTRKLEEEFLKKEEQRETQKKEKAKSLDDAIKNSKYVKNIDGLEAHKESFEKFGIEELDSAIQEALENAGNEGNNKSIKNVLKIVKAVIANGNPQLKIKDLIEKNSGKDNAVDNILDYLLQKYSAKKTTPKKDGNLFKQLMQQLKDADKKGDADTVNSIISKISSDMLSFAQQGAKESDFEYISKLELKYKKQNKKENNNVDWFIPNEVSLEISEKDGVKTTKFTWWRKNKLDKLAPTMGSGLAIDVDTIDETSIDTEDIEKPVLTELREKDGKFAGTIRYSLKGLKGRIETDVKFKSDPTKSFKSVTAQLFIDRMNAATTHAENDKAANDASKAGIPEKEWMGAYHRNESRIEKEKEKGSDNKETKDRYSVNPELSITKKLANEVFDLLYTNAAEDKDVNMFEQPKMLATADYLNGKLNDKLYLKKLEYTEGWVDKLTKEEAEKLAKEKAEARRKYLLDSDSSKDEKKEQLEEQLEEPEEKIILADDLSTLLLVNAFYKANHLNAEDLSVAEQQQIIDNIEKVSDLINKNQEIPAELQPYANIILSEKDNPAIIKSPEHNEPGVNATADNELNGAFLGLYDVGNVAKGRVNKLLQMEAVVPEDTKSIDYFYGSVQLAERVLWSIDNILKDLKKDNVPIKIIVDTSKPNILYPAVKVTDKLKEKAKNAWTVNTQDGLYIIIGTLGFNYGSTSLQELWQQILDDTLNLKENTNYDGYFVNTNNKYTFKINNIGDGRPAKKHYKHVSTTNIVELITSADKGRNPLNFTLRDLKWQIIYTDETNPKSVHVNSGDRIRGNANKRAGKVYVLVPTPSGAYYRHPINPVTIDEINKDSKLYKTIDKLIEDIIRKKEVKDIIKLKDKLVLESDLEDRSYLDVYFNSDGIRVKYIPHGSEGNSQSIILSQDEDEAINQLKDIIYSKVRPFISVTLAHLSSPNTIKELSAAGALLLKGELGIFSYVGANYTVIPYNENTNSKPQQRRKSSLETEEIELRYDGKLIFKVGNNYYRNDKIIVDAREIEILNDISAINDGQYAGETLWQYKRTGFKKNGKPKYTKELLEGQYYIILKGDYTVIYHKDARGNITKVSTKRTKELLKIKDKMKDSAPNLKPDVDVVEDTNDNNDLDIELEDVREEQEDLTKVGTTVLESLSYNVKNRHSNGNVRGGQDGWKVRFIVKNPKTGKPFTIGEYNENNHEDYYAAAKPLLEYLKKYFTNPDGVNQITLLKLSGPYEAHYVYEDKLGTREPFKFLTGGEVGESDFTIYIGSMEDVLKFISDVKESPIYDLLAEGNSNNSDTSLDDKIHGRIEGRGIGFSGYMLPQGLERLVPNFSTVYEDDRVEITINDKEYLVKDKKTEKYYGVNFTAVDSLDSALGYVAKNINKIRTKIAENIYGEYITGNQNINSDQEAKEETINKEEKSIEQRKQDSIKRATYDLELAGIKIGDFISQGLNQDLTELGKIIDIIFDNSLNPDSDNDAYSYSDINGTVYAVILTSDPSIKSQIRVDKILKSGGYYKKVNKQSQKPLIDLDNSENNSTFVNRLLNSKENTLELEDVIYEKASIIAEKKGIDFDDDCSVEELVKWFKENINFDLNSIPSNADINTVRDIIENCK